MTVAISNLTSGTSTSDPAATASVSPAAGSAVLASVGMSLASGFPTDALTVSGLGLTWTKLATVTWTSRRRLWIYVGTGTVSSGTVTIDHSAAYQAVSWVLDEVTGLDHTDPMIGTAGTWGDTNSTGFATGAANATGTVADGDATYSALQLEVVQTIDASNDESGYTFLAAAPDDTNGVRRLATSWLPQVGDGDKGCTWTWPTTSGSGTASVLLRAAPPVTWRPKASLIRL